MRINHFFQYRISRRLVVLRLVGWLGGWTEKYFSFALDKWTHPALRAFLPLRC